MPALGATREKQNTRPRKSLRREETIILIRGENEKEVVLEMWLS
jgi:hypothetical protein